MPLHLARHIQRRLRPWTPWVAITVFCLAATTLPRDTLAQAWEVTESLPVGIFAHVDAFASTSSPNGRPFLINDGDDIQPGGNPRMYSYILTLDSRRIELDADNVDHTVSPKSGAFYAIERTLRLGPIDPRRVDTQRSGQKHLGLDSGFVEKIFRDGFESGDTSAWSEALP